MSDLLIREARAADLEAIIRLHEADETGGHGDAWTDANRPAYEAAFASIQGSSVSRIYVAVDGDEVVGTFQLTVRPVLTHRGSLRAAVESVQVQADRRSKGIGARMMVFAEAEARARGAASLQLVSNKKRGDAHRFYERLGYKRSHEGFKKALDGD